MFTASGLGAMRANTTMLTLRRRAAARVVARPGRFPSPARVFAQAASSSSSSSSSSGTVQPTNTRAAAAYDCSCCPPGSPFLFRLPELTRPASARGVSTSTRSASGSPAALASAVPSDVPSVASDLVAYLNASWTAFHACAESAKMLTAAGYTRLSERDEWDLKRGGKYFFTRNASSVVAFAVGEKYEPGAGFAIVGAHTDSPCPKLKPVSAVRKGGFLGVGVQTYGGGLWHTWFDRDLSVAGRVMLRRGKDGGRTTHELVRVDRPIMRIPTLAIHLDRNVNADGFKPNAETHLAPLLATAIKGELEASDGALESSDRANETGDEKTKRRKKKEPHHPLLLAVLAEELDCDPGDIVDFELEVCDTQPSVIGGAAREFIYSGRLDNLASSYCALRALLDARPLAEETGVRMVALFDNEEVGSDSAAGAGGTVVADAIRRAVAALCRGSDEEGLHERTARNSFLVSADMAHALHPNYPEKHEGNHAPRMHKGVVVKHNANQRYATTAVTATIFRRCAAMEGIPTQDFVVRNDMGCGSTIGPILSTNLGIRTVDVGVPQLSMHSVREMCGTEDIDICARHFTAFFDNFARVDADVDDVDMP